MNIQDLSNVSVDNLAKVKVPSREEIQRLQNELMDEEKINCELESDLIYLLADGYPDSYCLRILLNQGRRAEGNWSSLAVTQLNAALKSFLTSGQK